jgi:aerobic-type carbon monoxide dehydrogenase small subunit (CoxS/CutS family)
VAAYARGADFGKRIDTIEGLAERVVAELQEEFIARNAAQCGFARLACC